MAGLAIVKSTPDHKQRVVVLGSTGSIGTSTLDVLRYHDERFEVVGLAAGSNAALLNKQVDEFSPAYIALSGGTPATSNARVIDTDDPLLTLATLAEVDIVVVATSGHVAIPATLAALEEGKIVALANKEVIVAAGHLAIDAAKRGNGEIRPVDSEHSAIWQCLDGKLRDRSEFERIILTASGGPFRNRDRSELFDVTPEEALQHPTWSMGARISIDSATLMNKGFELIETTWLFDCPIDKVDVVIHPQSIVHSMVEYADGSIIAQLGSQDMRIPIQYALTYPDRPVSPGRKITLDDLTQLQFETPREDDFPALRLAREAALLGSTYPTILSTADEVAVEAFLAGKISFPDITDLCHRMMELHRGGSSHPDLQEILDTDAEARRMAADLVKSLSQRSL